MGNMIQRVKFLLILLTEEGRHENRKKREYERQKSEESCFHQIMCRMECNSYSKQFKEDKLDCIS